MPRHSSRFLALAERGAEVRLAELAGELKILFANFPRLRDSFDADELPVKFIIAAGAQGAAPLVSPGARMSRAARRAATDRMKKRRETRNREKQA